jgi:hypothetical protein
MTGKHADQSAPEHRARLVNLAYEILSPVLGQRRNLIARVAVEQALRPLPGDTEPADYRAQRANVVRRALSTGRRRSVGPASAAHGLRQAKASAGADELAWLLPATRAAYALHHLEGLDRTETQELLAAAGVGDPAAATTHAARIGRLHNQGKRAAVLGAFP